MKRSEEQPLPWRAGSCSSETAPGPVLVYRLAGDLDLDSGSALLFDTPLDGFHAVVVDLADTGFFGSTALNALLRLRLDAEHGGVRVHLSALPPAVTRVLEVTGADTLFAVHADLGAALHAVR